MSSTSGIDLHAIVTRLSRSGDSEAASIINKLIDDLSLCEMANEQLETKTALAEKAREDAESRNDFLIQEIEAAIVRSKTKDARP